MRENRQSGSEGGGAEPALPTPIQEVRRDATLAKIAKLDAGGNATGSVTHLGSTLKGRKRLQTMIARSRSAEKRHSLAPVN